MRDTIDVFAARRLALLRAGLSGSEAQEASTAGAARRAAHRVLSRIGYLQLDTVSVAGARSHSLILQSRIDGITPDVAESLLRPGAPLWEGLGHEACWMPLDLWPCFAFRRDRYRVHPRWGPFLAGTKDVAADLLRRARDDGPFRSADLEGDSGTGFWRGKPAKRVAEALWRTGDLAIRERRGFQRCYDLAERVVPDAVRSRSVSVDAAHRELILRALAGHGWAEARTIAATWRLRPTSDAFRRALRELVESGEIVACALADGRDRVPGWIRPSDLDISDRLDRRTFHGSSPVLLTPFDPLLWDRARVRRLFAFDVVLEIYVPAAKRRFGYFAMPVLSGERLIGRVDVKADRDAGVVRAVSSHYENARPAAGDRYAVRAALARHARAVGLPPAVS
ncbi:MAG: hypothetical protein HMLKMBBP_00037 [Planctomycetes bacterium]|nr:hypothetical protein [Planctomycetota bacterium]